MERQTKTCGYSVKMILYLGVNLIPCQIYDHCITFCCSFIKAAVVVSYQAQLGGGWLEENVLLKIRMDL